jgi:pyridoxal 5'-phosphate synthase pdxS subunit
LRTVHGAIKRLQSVPFEELMTEAKNLGAPYELVVEVARSGKLPVPNFSAGGVATPADAALMMQLGAEAVFVGSGIFKSDDPAQRARAIVDAVTHFNNPAKLVECSMELGDAMGGLDVRVMSEGERLAGRGW